MSRGGNGMIGAATFWVMLAAGGCDDGPVGKAINCAKICDKLDACLPNVDEAECREDCSDDAANDDAAKCADCLDGDSCGECSLKCAGVGLSLLFGK